MNEITLQYRSGEVDVYACVFNLVGLVYSFITTTFVTWNNTNINDYAIEMTETGGGKFYGTFPVISAGDYSVTGYQGTRISSDKFLDSGPISWDGTAEIKLTTTNIVSRVFSFVGVTAGGITTFAEAIKYNLAALLGKFQDKYVGSDVKQVLDIDDGSPVYEVAVSATTPQREVEIL